MQERARNLLIDLSNKANKQDVAAFVGRDASSCAFSVSFSFNVRQPLTCTFLYLFKHRLLKQNANQKLDSLSNWSDMQNPLYCFSPESMWEPPLSTRRHVPSSLHQGEVQVWLCTYLQWRSLRDSKWVNDKHVNSCFSYPIPEVTVIAIVQKISNTKEFRARFGIGCVLSWYQ